MPEPISVSVSINGKVQGVFYRATVLNWAQELGITGWVRNKADGSVEALLQHKSQAVLDEMLKRMWRGPEQALVTSLHSEKLDGQLAFHEFMIRRN